MHSLPSQASHVDLVDLQAKWVFVDLIHKLHCHIHILHIVFVPLPYHIITIIKWVIGLQMGNLFLRTLLQGGQIGKNWQGLSIHYLTVSETQVLHLKDNYNFSNCLVILLLIAQPLNIILT